VSTLAPDGDGTCDRHTRRVTVAASGGAQELVEVVQRLGDAGIEVDDVGLRRPTLDDVFLTLTGHVAEEGDAEGDDEDEPDEELAA
jgi:ABC-2 type transport system ATP-binding protein